MKHHLKTFIRIGVAASCLLIAAQSAPTNPTISQIVSEKTIELYQRDLKAVRRDAAAGKIKAIVTDYDGTLGVKNDPLDKDLLSIFDKLRREKDIKVVLCTGRCPKSFYDVYQRNVASSFSDVSILTGGSVVAEFADLVTERDEYRQLYQFSSPLTIKAIQELHQLVADFRLQDQIVIVLYSGMKHYYTYYLKDDEDSSKFLHTHYAEPVPEYLDVDDISEDMIFERVFLIDPTQDTPALNQMTDFFNKKDGKGDEFLTKYEMESMLSQPQHMELFLKGCDKGSTLEKVLQEKYKINLNKDVLTIGDSQNDLAFMAPSNWKMLIPHKESEASRQSSENMRNKLEATIEFPDQQFFIKSPWMLGENKNYHPVAHALDQIFELGYFREEDYAAGDALKSRGT